jgi:hypothetical protein
MTFRRNQGVEPVVKIGAFGWADEAPKMPRCARNAIAYFSEKEQFEKWIFQVEIICRRKFKNLFIKSTVNEKRIWLL